MPCVLLHYYYCVVNARQPVRSGPVLCSGIAWNDSLSYDLGAIVGDEGRALWLLGATEASNAMHIGLDCW